MAILHFLFPVLGVNATMVWRLGLVCLTARLVAFSVTYNTREWICSVDKDHDRNGRRAFRAQNEHN
jgi:hypothetical protein